MIAWIQKASADAEVVLSVCTGAFLLAKAGLLDGKEATTHWGSIDALKKAAPKTKVHADRRFVDNGKVVTVRRRFRRDRRRLARRRTAAGQAGGPGHGSLHGVPLGAGFPRNQ